MCDAPGALAVKAQASVSGMRFRGNGSKVYGTAKNCKKEENK